MAPRSRYTPDRYMKFCDRCSRIPWDSLANALETHDRVPLFREPRLVRELDNYKCDLCLHVRRCLKRQTSSPSAMVEIYWLNRRRDFELEVVQYDGARERPAYGHLSSAADTQSQSLSSVAGITRFWWKDCVLNHSLCNLFKSRQEQQMSSLPSRVVDVDLHGTKPRLISSRGACGQYATLSYTWGIGERFMTTSENLAQLSNLIEVDELPKLFRQAIELTRQIGIRFLWIDALCIVQDSQYEVERELKELMPIYTKATITLAAVGQTNVHEDLVRQDPIRTDWHQSNNVIDELYTAHLSTGHPGILQHSLHTRAWCLQETLLSKRILVLGLNEAFWYCQSYQRRAKEHKLKEAREPKDYEAEIYGPLTDRNVLSTSLESRPFNFWYNTIAKYSKRKLTYQEDRLPAINGIAKLIAERYLPTENNEYILGLWRADLFHGLLWRGYAVACTDSHPPEHFGPSWTWASWPIEVHWRRHVHQDNNPETAAPQYKQLATIKRCKVIETAPRLQHGQADPEGRTDKANLILRGKIAVSNPHIDEETGRPSPSSPPLCSCNTEGPISQVVQSSDLVNLPPCTCTRAYLNFPDMSSRTDGLEPPSWRNIYLQMTPCEVLILAPVADRDQDPDQLDTAQEDTDFAYPYVRIGILVADSAIRLEWSEEKKNVLVV